MQKKILITGASGFIGSFLVEKALEEGFEVWAGVRATSDKTYLKDDRIRFIDLNFRDCAQLTGQIQKHASEQGSWNYVVHNAGLTKCLHPEDFDTINFRYTANLIDALLASGHAPEKFVLMSSLSASYPDTLYGKSKLKAEEYLLSKPELPSVIMRPTGVYGPREKDYLLMMKAVQSGLDVAAGFKPQQLTFIFVSDLINVVFLALKSPLSGKIYSVSDGKVYSDTEYTQIVKEVLGKKFVVRIKVPLFLLYMVSFFAEKISHFTGKPSTLNRDKFQIMKQRDWTCDTRPLQQDLSFFPAYDLRQGMQICARWYKENGWL